MNGKDLNQLLLLLPALIMSQLTYATLIDVPDDFETVQSALDQCESGDTVLVAPGTYSENLVIGRVAVTLASHYILDNDTNHIESTILRPRIDGTVITFIGEQIETKLIGFTVTGGSGTEIELDRRVRKVGGGILVQGATPSIRNCKIVENEIDYNYIEGIGIFIRDSEVLIENCHIYDNIPGQRSGVADGISVYESNVNILNSNIHDNSYIGIDMYNSTFEITGCSIANHSYV